MAVRETIAGATNETKPPSADVESLKIPEMRGEPSSSPFIVTVKADVPLAARAVVITSEVLVVVTAGEEPVIAATLASPEAKEAVPTK